MPKRTQFYQIMPWTGGLNSSVDPGVLPAQDLVQADNVLFASSGARIKRQGFTYHDDIAIPATTKRESSGTTRKITFASTIKEIAPANEILSVGESVTISGMGDNDYNGTFVITAISTTDTSNDTIEFTGTGSKSETSTADTGGTVTRTYEINTIKDYWYNDSGIKRQKFVAVTKQPRIFTYNSDGNRLILTAAGAVAQVTDITLPAASEISSGNSFIIYSANDATQYYFWFNKDGSEGDPAIPGMTGIEVNINTGDTAEEVAEELEVAVQGKERYNITCADSPSMSTGEYFTINAANDSTEYYVWFNINSGGGDPAPAGKTGIEVAVGASDTAVDNAASLAAALDAQADFDATDNSDVVTVTNAAAGAATDAANVDVSSPFAIVKTAEGQTAVTDFTLSRTAEVVTFTNAATGDTTDAFNFTMDPLSEFFIDVTTQGEDGAPALTDSDVKSDAQVVNNRLIISFEGTNNTPVKYYPVDSDTTYEALQGAPPNFSIMSFHDSRLFTNDKERPDRLHYSSPFNPEEWQGKGDSGARDIARGDGDRDGITAIFPSFKGRLIVSKNTSLYQVIGDTPELYQVATISKGIGCVGHKAVATVDESDIFFVSYKGIHSLQATFDSGDFDGNFLSRKIQPTFNQFERDLLSEIQALYVDSLNSVFFSIADDSDTNLTDLYGFNVEIGEWYRWPNVNATALGTYVKSDRTKKMYFGDSSGRISETQNGDYTDYTNQSYEYKLKTGAIYPNQDMISVKGFKKLTYLYKPQGDFVFSSKAKIDNGDSQSIAFAQVTSGDILGTTFTLGSSVLGIETVFAPFTQQIDGYGRGITLELSQNAANEQVEIYGYMIEYELAGDAQESNLGASSGTT